VLPERSNRGGRGPALLVILLVLVLAVPSPARGRRRPRDPVREWAKGPVRYLMTRGEAKLWRKLKTREDRIAFIRRFWERRDPDPRTPENEFRLVFWHRVREANRLFDDTPLPGWKTDRGKIYILLGPPTDIERDDNYDHREEGSVGRGLLRWVYHGLRRAANSAYYVVAFVRTGDGDWHLTREPRFNSPYFDITDPFPSRQDPDTALSRLFELVPWEDGNLGIAMDLAALQEVPSERELLRRVVEAEQFLGTCRGAISFHPVTSADGRRLVAITLAIRREDLSPPWDGSATGLADRFAASAMIRPAKDNPRAPIEVPDDAFAGEPAPDPAAPWLLFQAVRPVPPGTWEVTGVVLDRRGGGAATARAPLEVPPLDRRSPAVTGPVLCRALAREPAPEAGRTWPFRWGDVVYVPRVDRVLGPGNPFRLFVGIAPPPGTDLPVSLDWSFERRSGPGGEWQAWGRPGHLDDARGPRAWDVPAGTLPPGEWRIRFVARAAAGPPLERTVSFTVRETAEREPPPTVLGPLAPARHPVPEAPTPEPAPMVGGDGGD